MIPTEVTSLCTDDEADLILLTTTTASTTTTTTNGEQNHKPEPHSFAWASNLLFLLGSILYVRLALWDIRIREQESFADDDDKTTQRKSVWLSPYMVLSAAAASCYVVDAALQVFKSPEETTNGSSSNSSSENNHNHLFHRFQSSRIAKLCVGLTFGLGALLDFMSAVSSTLNDQRWTNWTAIGAAHAYLLNAILLLAGKKVASFLTLADSVEMVGDGLFLVGSVVGVLLSYFYNVKTPYGVLKYVDQGNLLTSVLWLVDALLYIAADVCVENEVDDEETSSDEEEAAPVESDAHSVPLLHSSSSSLVLLDDSSEMSSEKSSIALVAYSNNSTIMDVL
jgi:Cation efflux family